MNKELLELYSDYLLSSFGATTATGLSAVLKGEVSHDRITHRVFRLFQRSIKLGI